MLDYGIIGNGITCALVKDNTSIDWLCYPTFSDGSVFAKLVDKKIGGSFRIKPEGKYKITQNYIKDTAILKTEFISRKDAFVVYDFFPRYKKLLKKKNEKLLKNNELIRIVKPVRGSPKIKIEFDPRPEYAEKEVVVTEKDGKLFYSSKGDLVLKTNTESDQIKKKETIELNYTRYFVFGSSNEEYSVKKCNKMFSATKSYWEKWCKTLILPEGNMKEIKRSAITLKLLTYSLKGSIIAAATTSVPECLESTRNWDYRFCWIRDATYAADALKKIGRDYESKKLLEFILEQVLENDFIQPIYGINGETNLKERELKHLEGFKGFGPVRTGNAAYNQDQHDIYGEVIDVIFLYFVYYGHEKMTKKYWRFLKYMINQIKFRWEKMDQSIWEYRGLCDHYTYSKFMCYVGVDRAIRIAQHFGKEDLVHKWLPLRDEIMEDILARGYDPDLGSFTISYSKKSHDASLLLMAYHEFLDKNDPRMINTVKAIYEKLRQGPLLQRYDIDDDFGKSTSAFTVCTFWLIDALYYIGEVQKARKLFTSIMKKSNHLGLFSEDIIIKNKKLIGNFPQAYIHTAIINSSVLLSEWSSKRKKIDWEAIPKRKRWF